MREGSLCAWVAPGDMGTRAVRQSAQLLRSERPSHPKPRLIVMASKITPTPKTSDTFPQSSNFGQPLPSACLHLDVSPASQTPHIVICDLKLVSLPVSTISIKVDTFPLCSKPKAGHQTWFLPFLSSIHPACHTSAPPANTSRSVAHLYFESVGFPLPHGHQSYAGPHHVTCCNSITSALVPSPSCPHLFSCCSHWDLPTGIRPLGL